MKAYSAAAEEVHPKQEVILKSGMSRISWVVMEQWACYPKCSQLDTTTESFKYDTCTSLQDVNFKQAVPFT